MYAPDVIEQLQSAINADDDLKHRLTITDCIKDAHNRAVMEATFDGKDVILKHYKDLSRSNRIEKEARLVQERADLLGTDTPARAPELYHVRSDLGFYLLEKCPGVAGDLFQDTTEKPIPHLIPSAVLWLGEIVKKSKETNEISLNYWQKVITRAPTFDLSQSAKLHYDVIRQKALTHLPNAAGQVTKFIGHGDFHPGNLLISEDKVYGIDFQAKSKVIVTREIVSFLIRTNALADTSGQIHGFSEDIVTPFKSILPDGELDRLLPVFLGLDLMRSFANDTRWRPQTLQCRDELIKRYLST